MEGSDPVSPAYADPKRPDFRPRSPHGITWVIMGLLGRQSTARTRPRAPAKATLNTSLTVHRLKEWLRAGRRWRARTPAPATARPRQAVASRTCGRRPNEAARPSPPRRRRACTSVRHRRTPARLVLRCVARLASRVTALHAINAWNKWQTSAEPARRFAEH